MIETALDRIVRKFWENAATLAPPERRRAIQRHARGREDTRKLRRSDFAIVSFGKSGRTWVNVMLSRYFQLRFKLPEFTLFSFDNYHDRNRAIPKILFTHDNYIQDYTGCGARKTAFYAKPTLLMVRHPADVAVSQFFQWRHRMRPHKKTMNGYPEAGAELSVYDFAMHDAGIRRVVAFLNDWARELPNIDNKLITRYETLRADPHAELRRILEWLGQTPTDAEIDQAIEFASFENLKRLEAEKAFAVGKRMNAGDAKNPDSFKVRRAKVGGYRDYFTDEQAREIEAYIAENLDPMFGYAAAATQATA
jgi:hypothetical protein